MTASVGELRRLRAGIAKLVIEDSAYTPILDRLDRMLHEAQVADATASRARYIVREYEIAELIG